MDNGRHSIDQIFTGRNIFTVPNYQRSYAWGEKQLADFFEDFKTDFLVESYYYGTILLQPSGREGNRERFEIVDGQQRITTLVVFMNCLIERLRTCDQDEYSCDELFSHYIKNRGIYVLSLQDEDNDYFSTSIIDNEQYAGVSTPAQSKLAYAKEYFQRKLADCTDDQLKSFVEKISGTSVLVYLIYDPKEAAMIFETTNDRGKPLTNLEKTKSFLMYKAAIGIPESSQILNRLQVRFNNIYRDFASIEKSFRDENSILQYNFIAYESWSNSGKRKEYQHYMDFMKSKADEYVKRNDAEGLQSYIEDYTNNIQQSFRTIKLMYEFRCSSFLDIVSLNRVANFLPLLIKCFRTDQTDVKINYKKICRLCEIFSFRVYVVCGYTTSKYQTKWYELARDFEGDFPRLEGSIIALIRKLKTDDDFLKELSKPDFYTFYTQSMDRNYFFWKYENYLRDNEQPVATPMSHDDLNEKKDNRLTLTIEHIVAQRNSDEQSRVANSSLPIKVGHFKMFNEKYLHSIGNLTIDPQSANSSKGKSDVEVKNNNYFVLAPYKSQNELASFMDDNKWTIKSIENRAKKILNFAKATWCDFSDYNDTVEDINLDESESDIDADNISEDFE